MGFTNTEMWQWLFASSPAPWHGECKRAVDSDSVVLASYAMADLPSFAVKTGALYWYPVVGHLLGCSPGPDWVLFG